MTKKEYIEKLAEEISAECVAEGFPSHGSNFELRFEQEKNLIESMSDEEFAEWISADPGTAPDFPEGIEPEEPLNDFDDFEII